MLWVGLTGGIGTGKSTVTRILRQAGIPVVDADVLAREVVKAGTEGHGEVIKAFGPASIDQNGELNRKEIGMKVFNDRTKLEVLERIIHPRVRALCLHEKNQLAAAGNAIAVYDVPLLFEKKLEASFDQVVVVTCDPQIQIDRLIKRDGFTEDEAIRRIAAQLPLSEKVKAAHFTIHNDGSALDLEKQVSNLLEKLRKI